jgi:flavodoxin
MPRAALVYVSMHRGNTRRIADAFANVLNADVCRPEDVTAEELARYALVGFGSGIYYGRHHRSLLSFAQSTAGEGRSAFVFSTAGLPFLSSIWHRPLRRRLYRRGWRILGEFTCPGWDSWGPLRLIGGLNRRRPDERDLGRAQEFARRLQDAVLRTLATEVDPTQHPAL